MVIKFNPAAPPVAVQPPPGMRKTPAALMMAPVSLTPLAPPSLTAPAARLPAPPDRDPAAERRQACFADRQRQLLDRVAQPGLQQSGQGSVLTSAQRAACESVLALVAAHALAQRAG